MKVYIFTWVTSVLVNFTLLLKLAWYCNSLNTIMDASFFLVAIVTFFLRHPLIIINYNWFPFLCFGGHLAYSPWFISSMIDTFCCIPRSSVNVIGTYTCLWTYICVSLIRYFMSSIFSQNNVYVDFWSRYLWIHIELNNENILILV